MYTASRSVTALPTISPSPLSPPPPPNLFTGINRNSPTQNRTAPLNQNVSAETPSPPMTNDSTTNDLNPLTPSPSPLNPEALNPTLPWSRSGSTTTPASPTPPSNSSAYLPHSSPTNARIVSIDKPHNTRRLVTSLLVFSAVVLPFVLLIWGSYQDWPQYYPLPPSVKLTVDRILAVSPLPKTPRMILSPMLATLSTLSSYKQQFSLTAINTKPAQKFTAIISGPVSITQTQTQVFYDISTSWTTSAGVPTSPPHSLTAKAISAQGLLELTIDHTSPFVNFKFDSILNQPIVFTLNPAPSEDLSHQSLTPGEQALTKIRNNKLSQLNRDYYTLLLEKATLQNSSEDVQPHHIVITQLTQTDILNYIKEFSTIFQESQPAPLFPQPALQKFYQQLEGLISPLDIKITIDKSTLQLIALDFSTRLNTHSLDNSDPNLLSAEKNNQFFLVTAQYSLSQPNQPVTIPPLSNGRPASELDWTTLITHPLLQPLMPKPRPPFD